MERTQAAIVEALILAAVASGDVTLPGADEGGAA
jgi:hypothetical protein